MADPRSRRRPAAPSRRGASPRSARRPARGRPARQRSRARPAGAPSAGVRAGAWPGQPDPAVRPPARRGRPAPRRRRTASRRARPTGAYPGAPVGSPCSRSPAVSSARSAQIGGEADHLEPAGGVRHEEERPVADPVAAVSHASAPAAWRSSPVATSTTWTWAVLKSVARCDIVARLSAVGRPGERVDVDAAPGQGSRLRWARVAARSAAARDRRVDQPDLRPAAAAREEGESPSVGRPAGMGVTGRMLDDHRLARAVGLDDPDGAVADEREAPSVGRPLGVRDGLLRRRDLDGHATAQRHREQLAGPGGLGGEGHDALAGMEAELPRRVDGDDRLDRQAVAPGRRAGRPWCGASPRGALRSGSPRPAAARRPAGRRASSRRPPGRPRRRLRRGWTRSRWDGASGDDRGDAAPPGRAAYAQTSSGSGQPTRAHHGPTIARWDRT